MVKGVIFRVQFLFRLSVDLHELRLALKQITVPISPHLIRRIFSKHLKKYNLEQEGTLFGWIDPKYSVPALSPTVEAEYVVVKFVRRSPVILKMKIYFSRNADYRFSLLLTSCSSALKNLYL